MLRAVRMWRRRCRALPAEAPGGSAARARSKALALLAAALAALLAGGCVQPMANQPRYEPLEASSFFANGQSAQPLQPDTIAQGQLMTDTLRASGTVDGRPGDTLPLPLTAELVARGRERYDIFCMPCHGMAGDGDGMIVQRGFPQPPSFHVDRLRQAPPGYIFGVITNGLGPMPPYRNQVPVDDRWAIVAYVRALQLSQHAPLESVPPALRPGGQEPMP